MIGITVNQRQATRRLEQEQKQRGKSRLLLSFTLIILLISVALWGFHELMDPAVLPIRSVKITGDFSNVDRGSLQKIVTSYTGKGFLGADVSGLKESLQKLPWVYTVSISRVWPDTLQINVTEQMPAAKWGDKALLNSVGELFDPGIVQVPDLPQLQGPFGEQNLVYHNFREMSDLIATLGLKIKWLELAARHAWRLQLSNGLIVILGRDDPLARLNQFVKIFPQLLGEQVNADNSLANNNSNDNQVSHQSNNQNNRVADYVDLRYEHGIAVHWKTV